MSVYAVLLVPAEGDPLGLLDAPGDFDAYPPMCWRWGADAESGKPDPWRPCTAYYHHDQGAEMALVLAWDGKPVAEGFDRLCRATCTAMGRDIRRLEYDAASTVSGAVDAVREAWHALSMSALRPGTIVLLDADGREVT